MSENCHPSTANAHHITAATVHVTTTTNFYQEKEKSEFQIHRLCIITDGGGQPSLVLGQGIFTFEGREIENIVLASVHMWIRRHHRKDIVELTLEHFPDFEIYHAMCLIAEYFGEEMPAKRRSSSERTAGDVYARELVDLVMKLDHDGQLPPILVSSRLLAVVPVGTMSDKDNIALGTRMNTLEKSIKVLNESIANFR